MAERIDIAGKASTTFQNRADRIPMTIPAQRLQVPSISGYCLHWFRGEPGRLQRALRAGYEFVTPDEVDLNNFDLAGDRSESGKTDMGDRVSVPAQDGVGEDGQYLRLYLMKIKEEYRKQDQNTYEERMIDPLVAALKAGRVGTDNSGETSEDVGLRYKKRAPLPDMFTKKVAKN